MADIQKSEANVPIVIDVRITDLGEVPPRYFMHDAVMEALRQVIRSDVVVHGNPVPAGVKPILGSNRVFAQRYRVGRILHETGNTLKRNSTVLILQVMALCLAGMLLFAAYLIWARG